MAILKKEHPYARLSLRSPPACRVSVRAPEPAQVIRTASDFVDEPMRHSPLGTP
jgi:hypothetical protein